MIPNKRAQPANEAWVLVGLITLLLVFYILFLPPADRKKLLEETPTTAQGLANSTLIVEHVGLLESHEPTIEHGIPPSHIFEAKKAVVLESFNPFFIKKGWFTQRNENLSFLIPDLEHTDNVVLAFDAPAHVGILTLKLNGRVIFESAITRSPAPIRIRKDWLQKENSLEFVVNNVGFAFWRVNQISFDNIKILGDVTDISRQKSQNVFAISPEEKRNLLIAKLLYTSDCKEHDVSPLMILVNNQRVFSGIPDCGGKNQIEISGTVFEEGVNTLTFQTNQGDYYLSNMKLITALKKTKAYINYFDISQELFSSVQSGTARVMLEIDFVDDQKPKSAQLNINGHVTYIDQIEPFYVRNLNTFILLGYRNYIEIVPDTSISIPQLRIVVK
ncbi:MAG: hypothetical protein AABX52_03265 [Nanoarchaeota archaeon]